MRKRSQSAPSNTSPAKSVCSLPNGFNMSGKAVPLSTIALRSVRSWAFARRAWRNGEALAAWLSEHVLNQDRQMDRLKATLMERCRSLHIEPPTQDRMDRLVRSAIHQHEERFCEALLTHV